MSKKTNESCLGKAHVLCLQDTVQLTYPTQTFKKNEFGPTGDANTKGLFVHPGIIVDASNRDVIGTSGIITWCRDHQSPNQTNIALLKKKNLFVGLIQQYQQKKI